MEQDAILIMASFIILRGVAELHVASGMPRWRMFVTSCYI